MSGMTGIPGMHGTPLTVAPWHVGERPWEPPSALYTVLRVMTQLTGSSSSTRWMSPVNRPVTLFSTRLNCAPPGSGK